MTDGTCEMTGRISGKTGSIAARIGAILEAIVATSAETFAMETTAMRAMIVGTFALTGAISEVIAATSGMTAGIFVWTGII